MRHSDAQIEQAAQRHENVIDALYPETVEAENLSDRNAVAAASQALPADEARLHEAVRTAREEGRSWNQLATALGVSRQAARQRFTDKVHG